VATKAVLEKNSSDSCEYDSRVAQQNRESGISSEMSRADVLFRISQNWSCN